MALVDLRKDTSDEEDNLACRFGDSAHGPGSLWGVLDYKHISTYKLRRHDEWRYLYYEHHQHHERQHHHFHDHSGGGGT